MMELSPGRKLFAEMREFYCEWAGRESGAKWTELPVSEKQRWEELAADKEAKQHEQDA